MRLFAIVRPARCWFWLAAPITPYRRNRSEQVVAKACRLGYHLQFRIFPGLDHDPLMDKSIAYQLRWIRARFASRPATDTCTSLIKPSLIKR